MTTRLEDSKHLVTSWRAALYNADRTELPRQLAALCANDCRARLPHPIDWLEGPDALFERGYAPLLDALPDLERREYLSIGATDDDGDWIGCSGYYVGVFEQPWLDIPATRHLAHIRYMEFFRVVDGKIVELRLLWDIPALMMQADAWPMAPSLGAELLVPGPATADGVVSNLSDPATSAASMRLVNAMVDGLGRFASGGAKAMELERFWHPKMTWYGPAGIGANRRVSGFRNWHQIPFLKSMPDRVADRSGDGFDCYFADGNYVAYCGWPAMRATVSSDGWMGIAPAGQKIRFSSLDIWRCEDGSIRENWVMIDIIDIWRQLGVDVFERMREVTFARQQRPFKP